MQKDDSGQGFVLVRFALGVSVRNRNAVEVARHDTLRDAPRALMRLSRAEENGVKTYEPAWLWSNREEDTPQLPGRLGTPGG